MCLIGQHIVQTSALSRDDANRVPLHPKFDTSFLEKEISGKTNKIKGKWNGVCSHASFWL